MREIKFRAWDDEIEEFVYFNWVYGVFPYLSVEQEHEDADRGNFHCQQYTGLKDKNGKEIYEGDIVRRFEVEELDTGIGIDSHEIEEGIHEVKWEEDDFGFNLWGDRFEVIGNIYANKELLK